MEWEKKLQKGRHRATHSIDDGQKMPYILCIWYQTLSKAHVKACHLLHLDVVSRIDLPDPTKAEDLQIRKEQPDPINNSNPADTYGLYTNTGTNQEACFTHGRRIPADRWWRRIRSRAPRQRRQQRCSPLQIAGPSRSPGGLSPPPVIQGPAAAPLPRTTDWWVRRSRRGAQEAEGASLRHGAPAGTTLWLARALPCQTHTHCKCSAWPSSNPLKWQLSSGQLERQILFIGGRVGIG